MEPRGHWDQLTPSVRDEGQGSISAPSHINPLLSTLLLARAEIRAVVRCQDA